MFNFLKRWFGGGAGVLGTAVIAVAKARVASSIEKTDKYSDSEKALLRELLDSFETELIKELTSPTTDDSSNS